MAELCLKVWTDPARGEADRGPSGSYADGDIIDVVNDRRIGEVHASRICHVKDAGFTRDGLRPNTALARDYRQSSSKYRFERISRTEVKRIDLATLDEEIFGLVPNAGGEQMDVPLFIKRRLEHVRHAIFGAPGAEIWYSPTRPMVTSGVADVWTAIEAKTALLRVDHTEFDWGSHPTLKRKFLFLRASADINDATVELWRRPRFKPNPLAGQDGERETILDLKRVHFIPWRVFAPYAGQNKDTVLDRSVDTEVRSDTRDIAAMVEAKA